MKHLSHFVMMIFGAVSVQNIAVYFIGAGHSVNVAYTLGGALGMALLTTSVMLTQIDQKHDRSALWWLLTAGIVLALVSGGIQSAEYAKHLEPMAAIGLGYGLPIGGEILLAFATSSYIAARRRQKIRMATDGTTERIAECVAEALSDVDVSKVRHYVETKVDAIVKAQVDAVASQLAPTSHLSTIPVDSSPEVSPVHQHFGPENLPKAQEKRAELLHEQTQQREAAIVAMLAEQGPLGTTAIATALDIHRDTARKHLQALAKGGQLSKNGHKWQLEDSEDSIKSQNKKDK